LKPTSVLLVWLEVFFVFANQLRNEDDQVYIRVDLQSSFFCEVTLLCSTSFPRLERANDLERNSAERVARRSGTQEWQQESLLLADNAKKRARAVVGVCVFSAVRSVFGYHATY